MKKKEAVWEYAFFRMEPDKSRKTSVRTVCKPLVGWLPVEYRPDV